jgi:two-component system, OmpR family, KDP operon response regulator KdpE
VKDKNQRIDRATTMGAGKILVVDDDPRIRRVLRIMLAGQGYEIDDAKDGKAALGKLRKRRFDLVLLDVGIHKMRGLETCRLIREQSEIAIIMMTARDRDADKIEALDAGANDYVTKPFKSFELSARVRATLRRPPLTDGPVGRLLLGSAAIDFDTRQVMVRSRHAHLTPKEFDLLRYLVAHPNRVVTHRELLDAVWGPERGEHVDALRVVITHLRRKIEAKPSSPEWILTEPWVGYRLFLPSKTRLAIAEPKDAWIRARR